MITIGTSTRRRTASMLCAIVLSSLPLWSQVPKPVQKIKPSAPRIPVSPQTAPELSADDVGAFLDGIIPLQLGREDIAGAVVVVVKDGKVLFSKGYGYADVK